MTLLSQLFDPAGRSGRALLFVFVFSSRMNSSCRLSAHRALSQNEIGVADQRPENFQTCDRLRHPIMRTRLPEGFSFDIRAISGRAAAGSFVRSVLAGARACRSIVATVSALLPSVNRSDSVVVSHWRCQLPGCSLASCDSSRAVRPVANCAFRCLLCSGASRTFPSSGYVM